MLTMKFTSCTSPTARVTPVIIRMKDLGPDDRHLEIRVQPARTHHDADTNLVYCLLDMFVCSMGKIYDQRDA